MSSPKVNPDLSNSITHHPSPFNLHQIRTSSSSPAPPRRSTFSDNGASTGIHTSKDGGAVARHNTADVENGMTADGKLPQPSPETDPYGLSAAFKTEAELETIKANTSKKRDGHSGSRTSSTLGESTTTTLSPGAQRIADGKTSKSILSSCLPIPSFGRKAIQARRIQGFYNKQNETIERLLKPVEEHVADARQEAGDDLVKVRIAIWGSFAANIILAGLQVYGAVSSASLSLFTTMADAIFDPLSNVTLIVSNRAVKSVDPARFPSGKARLETVGNIAFCFLMTAVSMILIAFSIKQLIDRQGEDSTNNFHIPSIIAVCVAFVTKLSLFFYTWALKDKYSQINILWQDHRNDLLINGFGILTSVGGSKLIWWIDPAGAIVLSVIVSTIWLRTAFTEFLLLVGVVGPVETQQLITYVCVTHDKAIKQIDTVRVYHSGPRLIAEVDVVMDPEATLRATHDVAEDLQMKLESLPDIERAYVHVDYETTHKPEHAYKKDI